MNYFKINPIYTVLDIGTTKIFAIIAENVDNKINILGIGSAPSHGLEKGIVANILLTTNAIKLAIEEAQMHAQISVDSVIVGISGSHIKSYFSQGMASISPQGITERTIHEATNAAQSIALSDDEKIIHIVPIGYIIDGQQNTKSPLKMHGFRLEVNTHIITANKHAIADIIECCKKAELKVKEIILEPIASAEGILNDQEKDFGALLIDIGGGTSDVILYKNNSIEYIEIMNIAGHLFTKDLSICLNINKNDAEEIKKKYGLYRNQNDLIEQIVVKGIDMESEQIVSSDLVNSILYARAEEFILNIINILDHYNNAYDIPSGIILTGGGALLKGLPDMISKYTGLRCRVGMPIHTNEAYKILKHPSYSTAYGLLLYGVKNDTRFKENEDSIMKKFQKLIEKFI